MLTLTKDLVPFIYVDSIRQGLTKGELSHHVKQYKTYQLPGAVKPVPILTKGLANQACQASGLHTTHKPGPLQDHHFVHFYNCNFLISLCYLVAETSTRSKQRIFENICKTR